MSRYQGLNDQQRLAAESPAGPILIIAGPGTGKTKTLIARLNFLLKTGIPADRLLALTFTNKAASEMKTRISTEPKPHITTFHALCHKFLTEIEGEAPTIISQVERQQIVRNLKKSRSQKGISMRELELYLSRLKNQSEPSDDELLLVYQQALAEKNLHDYDDLLLKLHRYLSKDVTLRTELQERYDAILVDEFQDTNELQYEILKLLNGTDNIFVIGDPAQSIYGFRGASAAVFDQFKRDWPTTRRVTLDTNYRSTVNVVNLGCHIFPGTPPLVAHRQTDGSVKAIHVLNEYSEAKWIINAIEASTGGSTMLMGSEHHTTQRSDHRFSDFAVLYRTHRTAAVIRRLLDETGLPYQVAGEGSPYSHPSVVALVQELKTMKTENTGPISQIIATKASNLGFDITSPDIRAVINHAVRFDKATLLDFLQHLDIIADTEFYDPSADAITLLTIHAAKGLEFGHVFLIGAEDGILPNHTPYRSADVNEERRLFYVAVTRARDTIDILHTKKRSGKPARISPFVTELPSSILPRGLDPNLTVEQEKSRKRALKRSQTSLF